MKKDDKDRSPWQLHEDEQRKAWLRLKPIERLRWLDDAKVFVANATRATRSRSEQDE